MAGRWIYIAALLFLLKASESAFACGGVTATIAHDPEPFGIKSETGPGGVTLHFDQAGNVHVAAKDIKISSAMAEAITKRYLKKKHQTYTHL